MQTFKQRKMQVRSVRIRKATQSIEAIINAKIGQYTQIIVTHILIDTIAQMNHLKQTTTKQIINTTDRFIINIVPNFILLASATTLAITASKPKPELYRFNIKLVTPKNAIRKTILFKISIKSVWWSEVRR